MIDLPPDVGTESQELPVNPVQHRLQEVPLPRVLAVKQLKHMEDEGLVDVSLCHGCLKVRRFKKAKEECIHQLEYVYIGEKDESMGFLKRKYEFMYT